MEGYLVGKPYYLVISYLDYFCGDPRNIKRTILSGRKAILSRRRFFDGKCFDIGRGLRERPRFHGVAQSVGAITGVDPAMEKVEQNQKS